MRTMVIRLFLSIFFFTALSSQLFAEENQEITVKFLPQGVVDQSDEDIQYHFIGGQDIVIPFWIYSGNEEMSFNTDVVQLGYSMQAPYEMKAVIKEEDFLKRHLALALPQVKRETEFEVNINAQKPEGEGNSVQNAGQLKLVVYPQNILKPLVKWSQKHHVRLRDPQWVLAEIFEKNGIEFFDYRAFIPKLENRPVVTIIVGEPEGEILKDRSDFGKESIIILREGNALFPFVKVEPLKTGTLVDAQVGIVDKLSRDLHAQKMLLELIKLSNTYHENQ